MKIRNHEIGTTHPCFIVAEIGINANGSVDIAKKLIDVASFAGADAVKFQKRTVDVVYTEEELARPRESPFGKTNGDLKRGLEFGFNEYDQIDRYCREKGILWFASAWDVGSLRFLEQFSPPCHKVASAMLTDHHLLYEIRRTNRAVIMSTGMSTYQEIHDAEKIWWGHRDLALMVTTSTYPASYISLNLDRIHTMMNHFPLRPIGYSGHETGLYTTLAAVGMGASLVERHITLDRSMWGTDQAASVEPGGFIKLVKEIRDFETARGDGKIGLQPGEEEVKKKLRRV